MTSALSGSEVTDGCEQQGMGLNPGPLEEQQALLTPEPRLNLTKLTRGLGHHCGIHLEF